MYQKTSPLRDKSTDLAIRVVHLGRFLMEEKKEFILSKQLIRSGTNPGAMVREASSAELDKDFIHKLAIGEKEIKETLYWLELLFKTDYIDENIYNELSELSTEIPKMIKSSINTKNKNMKSLS